MTEKIGKNAGLVWNALDKGLSNIKDIKKETKLLEKDLYAALGWLARENKISFNEVEKEIFIRLV
jgi:hypothetical protein